MCICICVYIYIYIYCHTWRGRERQIERDRRKVRYCSISLYKVNYRSYTATETDPRRNGSTSLYGFVARRKKQQLATLTLSLLGCWYPFRGLVICEQNCFFDLGANQFGKFSHEEPNDIFVTLWLNGLTAQQSNINEVWLRFFPSHSHRTAHGRGADASRPSAGGHARSYAGDSPGLADSREGGRVLSIEIPLPRIARQGVACLISIRG